MNSGDSVTITKLDNDVEKRVFLAGIRAPGVAIPKNPEKAQPYGWEAKEFLRKLLIGKQVEVEVEYTKTPAKVEKEPAEFQKKPMTFASVILPDGKCANVEIVEAGLANMMTPRTDEVLSHYYGQMTEAFGRAKAAKKGIHTIGTNPPVHSYHDITGPQNPKTIAYYQDLFSKNSHIIGVVEYCFSGSRFKLRVDEANCYISFICQGMLPLPQDPNMPELQNIIKQGQKFARFMVLQRDAKIDILTSDRKGNFFGVLMIGSKNYVISLLEEGLAVINRIPGRGPPGKSDLYEQAEKKAKEEMKGLWDPKANISLDLIAPVEKQLEFVEGKSKIEIVSYPSHRFFYALSTDDTITKKVEEVLSKEFSPAKAEKLLLPIRRGTYCMALFTEDKKWYRGQVEQIVSEDACEVLFIDYGNTETMKVSDLRKIDSKLIQKYPAQCLKVSLAYLEFPRLDAELGGKKLRQILQDQLEDREVIALHKYKSEGTLYAILLQGEEMDPMKSFNAYMLKRGLAKVTKRIKLPGYLIEWADIQDKARTEQVGFWETSELGENSDEDI